MDKLYFSADMKFITYQIKFFSCVTVLFNMKIKTGRRTKNSLQLYYYNQYNSYIKVNYSTITSKYRKIKHNYMHLNETIFMLL